MVRNEGKINQSAKVKRAELLAEGVGIQGVLGTSWQVKGSALAEGEAEPHKRSRRRSGQNAVQLKTD